MRLTMLALAACTLTTHAVAQAAANKPDLAKGQQIASTVCVGCHGPDGNSPAAVNPKLAGQHQEYLLKQLRNFKAPDGSPDRRVNPVMNGMVAALSEDDMRNIAAFFATQKLSPETAKNRQTIEVGQKLWRAGDGAKGVPACAGCHGPSGAGMPAQYPRLSGQYAEYTESQLKAFRLGERANDANKMMRTIAIKMTDAEIKAVSDYAAGLR